MARKRAYKLHHLRSNGIGARCATPTFHLLSRNIGPVNCLRCLHFHERGVEAETDELATKLIAQAVTQQALRAH